jgi:hypothetical protein
MWPLLQALGFGVVLWFVTRPPRQLPETAEPVAAAPEPHDDPDIVIHRSIEAPQVPGMPDVELLLDTTARAYRSDAAEMESALGRAHDGCVGWLAGKFLDRLERQAAFHLF